MPSTFPALRNLVKAAEAYLTPINNIGLSDVTVRTLTLSAATDLHEALRDARHALKVQDELADEAAFDEGEE